MLHGDALGLLVGAVALGAVHGIEPGHGWPVAASYALDQANKWLYGLAASLIIGVGHLISSISMVAVFFYAKSYFDLTQVNEPITVAEWDLQVGGPVSLVAGVVLVALGVREYRHGHSHGQTHGTEGHGHDRSDHQVHANGEHSHGGGHGHSHGDGDQGKMHDLGGANDHAHDDGDVHRQVHDDGDPHAHAHDDGDVHDDGDAHDHDHEREAGLRERIGQSLPFVGGHSHDHADLEEAADRGLLGIAWFAFLLGFAHEEEFEIIALCAGSNHCLELMSAYALTVILGIVGLTMLLIAGYHHFEETVEQYTPYLPAFSAAVLGVMGVGFILGLF